MLLEKDLKKLFGQLLHNDVGVITLGNSDVKIRVFDNASKVSISSMVFSGGNFIPSSVRKSISHKAPFQDKSTIKTSLSLDEDNFQVGLHYLGSLEHLDNRSFKEVLEEFGWLADEWRLYLEEHGKNDLIHIHAK